jgi:hypothetical protein
MCLEGAKEVNLAKQKGGKMSFLEGVERVENFRNKV